jgi:vitamin B12 transporter
LLAGTLATRKTMKQTNNARLFGAVIISPFLLSSVFAGENILLNDAVVTATRTPQPREAVIADVSVIDADEIERAGQHTLVEILQSQPGIEITNSGGAGSVSGIFIRGTNSSHVVVLIDGIHINSATVGITAFENLPTSQIEKIEILRGPATSLYGQDAIGGVIQIFTKKADASNDAAIKLNANLGYGSYATVRADAGVTGNVANTRFALNVSSLNTNSFSAIDTKNKAYNDNDANRNLAFTGNISHQIVAGHEIGFQFLHSDGKVHFDNSFNGSNFDSRGEAKQYSYALFSNNQFTDFWLSKVRIGEGVDESRTFDVTSIKGGEFYQTKQFQLNWQNDFKLPIGVLSLMYDGLQQKVNSNTVSYTVKTRDNDGLVASYLLDYNAHAFQLSLRHDNNSQFGNHNTGGIGYGFKINTHWRITANYGTAFKAPNFNELYYPLQDFGGGFSFGGNPNLKPEKSRNIEASLRYVDGGTSLSATVFHNKINDLIASNDLPANQSINLKKASIKGLTINAQQRFDNINLGASLDFQSAKDDETDNLLTRRANRHASLTAGYNVGNWRFGAETIASSLRFNDAANTQKLAGYALLNATVDYQINKDWAVQARANNILDKNYALGLDFGGEAYNTPGANLFVNIRYQP